MFGFEKMNKIIVVGIVVMLLLNVTLTLVGFSYLQNEINQLKSEDTNQLTTYPPTEQPEQEPTDATEPEPTPPEYTEPEPVEAESMEPTTDVDGTAEYTFIVYRWWNGDVTRNMLNKVYAGRSVILAPLLFTYRLNSTYGMAAYYPYFGQGFSTVTSDFEKVLTEITEKWTKTNETARIPYRVYQTTDHPEYSYLFP
ncbi:MAG: hypothetical protein CW716_10725 [Candidatus Bathyarchaeum sp.]|nr:MAG: hypothetical protein CW716_10725 [Candidatus Bathyarchaeum sp.]